MYNNRVVELTKSLELLPACAVDMSPSGGAMIATTDDTTGRTRGQRSRVEKAPAQGRFETLDVEGYTAVGLMVPDNNGSDKGF